MRSCSKVKDKEICVNVVEIPHEFCFLRRLKRGKPRNLAVACNEADVFIFGGFYDALKRCFFRKVSSDAAVLYVMPDCQMKVRGAQV